MPLPHSQYFFFSSPCQQQVISAYHVIIPTSSTDIYFPLFQIPIAACVGTHNIPSCCSVCILLSLVLFRIIYWMLVYCFV
ncbi:hypothetical protein F4604DRAFT_1779184 [Suillus subluteus]|nr:hypothetical protein F4604DRAFT_1779184 [Suillus subluteus]